MLVIELNEFDPDYLKKEANKLNLKNILFFLNFKHSYTFTKEEKDLLVADESKGESIKRMKYDGCPHWQNKKKLDDFLS